VDTKGQPKKLVAEGHRGAGIHCVHNTITSFTRAIEFGLESIELDAWLAADGEIMVLHGVDDDKVRLVKDGPLNRIGTLTSG